MSDLRLSIVSPTYNEIENIKSLATLIEQAMGPEGWELLFVDDDSPDGTSDYVRELARTDRRIRCVQRIGRRGLASACVEGMLASSAPCIAVIDADLQHDERLLPKMTALMETNDLDLVIATRYAAGGGTGSWDEGRKALSRFATTLAQRLLKQNVSDPMSGYFLVSRSMINESVRRLSGIGFKILLDILMSSPRRLRIDEVPYTFRDRQAGTSKLDSTEIWNFGMLLVDKTVGRFIPVRFVAFIMVGGLGTLVHMSVLYILFGASITTFVIAQALATIIAMIFNFYLNNLLTYRDMRLVGRKWLTGLATFMLVCSLGAIANIGVADYLFQRDSKWAIAGLAGILVGAVWNFAMTRLYTWRGN
jgi:dolichol-phosphate mannosyltransferase